MVCRSPGIKLLTGRGSFGFWQPLRLLRPWEIYCVECQIYLCSMLDCPQSSVLYLIDYIPPLISFRNAHSDIPFTAAIAVVLTQVLLHHRSRWRTVSTWSPTTHQQGKCAVVVGTIQRGCKDILGSNRWRFFWSLAEFKNVTCKN
jgi:hypothetical protein